MNVVTILVGNKTDLKDAREVSTAEGKTLAEAQGLFFMETSALDSSNVATAFQTVVEEIYHTVSRKVFLSQEQQKHEMSSLTNGKTVVLQGDTKDASGGSRGFCQPVRSGSGAHDWVKSVARLLSLVETRDHVCRALCVMEAVDAQNRDWIRRAVIERCALDSK
ncbi:hypothetical protein GW17_00003772 [Ensete ventricosum]|nr:hypothetical protein GW17_00003772 [Ensete ventricosum]